MGPLPKRKLSRRSKGNRRAHHAIQLGHLVRCDNCNEFKPAHQVCPACGTYNGKLVFEIESDK